MSLTFYMAALKSHFDESGIWTFFSSFFILYEIRSEVTQNLLMYVYVLLLELQSQRDLFITTIQNYRI